MQTKSVLAYSSCYWPAGRPAIIHKLRQQQQQQKKWKLLLSRGRNTLVASIWPPSRVVLFNRLLVWVDFLLAKYNNNNEEEVATKSFPIEAEAEAKAETDFKLQQQQQD